MVDRNRTCRNANLGYLIAAESILAQLYQPVCGGYDAVCSSLRRHVSAASHGPSVAVLLDVPLSQFHGRATAIPQPPGMGCLRRIHLCHGIVPVLVRGPAA